MAQTNYYIGRTTNSAGESEINLRLYISRDVRLRIGSGIWIDRKRWGKKNDINIPLIQGEEREQLLGKRSRLKALTDLLEQEINTTPDKAAITREYMQGIVKRFHKPTKAKKEHEKTFFNVIDIYLATHKLSENRLKNFRVLVRCLHRFELYMRAEESRGFSLSFMMLTPELLRRIENFLLDERSVFLHYPQIYEQYPYSAKVAVKTPKRKRPPVLDGEGNEVPKGLPKLRGLNTVADMLTRFRAFILWAIDNGHTTNNPFKHFTIGEIVYGTPIYITNEERTQLLEADLSGNKEVETQRDIFIFHCFIGCRVSDLFKMTYRRYAHREVGPYITSDELVRLDRYIEYYALQESGSTELTPIRPQKLKNADLFHFGWNMAHYFGRPKQEVVPWLKSAFALLAELEDSYIKGKLYSPQTRQFIIPNIADIPKYMAEHDS